MRLASYPKIKELATTYGMHKNQIDSESAICSHVAGSCCLPLVLIGTTKWVQRCADCLQQKKKQ